MCKTFIVTWIHGVHTSRLMNLFCARLDDGGVMKGRLRFETVKRLFGHGYGGEKSG